MSRIRLMTLAALWGAATGSVALATAAFAAAPSTDALLPTTNFNNQCIAAVDPDNGDIYSGACRTDNAALSYYMDSNGTYELEDPDRTVVVNVMAIQVAPTDISVSYDSSPTYSGPSETDVIYQEGSTGMPSYAVGMTWCNDPENGTAHLCDQFYIRIRGNGQIDAITAGHETGHAIGLAHPSWATPTYASCATSFHVMREAYSCIDNGNFGTMLTNNINWVY